MAPHKPPLPKAAEPKYGRSFDPWNSSATGHQRAETRGPAGWQNSRNFKLHSQFCAGNTGGGRLSDLVGAAAEDFDEKRKVLVPKEIRSRALNSVADMLRKPGSMMGAATAGRNTSSPVKDQPESTERDPLSAEEQLTARRRLEDESRAAAREQSHKKIFDGLVIYINGSVFPLMSDHKLKHILAENGAHMSIHLGRRQVTHVILGRPNGARGGAGGGLASGKLEKEIRRVGGCGVKYVGVEW